MVGDKVRISSKLLGQAAQAVGNTTKLLIPAWAAGAHVVGDLCQSGGRVFVCKAAVTDSAAPPAGGDANWDDVTEAITHIRVSGYTADNGGGPNTSNLYIGRKSGGNTDSPICVEADASSVTQNLAITETEPQTLYVTGVHANSVGVRVAVFG
jgi:hypothetical protein